MLSRLKARMTYANVASTAALVIAIGGGGAAVAVAMVPANSVGSPQIINGSVKGVDLSRHAIASPKAFGAGNLGVVRGYAWNDSPSADANLTHNGYTYNRSGRKVTVTYNGVGSYSVKFAGLRLNGGNVVVSGYGSNTAWCKVGSWGSDTVDVSCFDGTGAPSDSEWTIAVSD